MANKPVSLDPSSLTLTFDDEFNSFTSSPDGSVGWMTQYPFWGSSRTLAPNHEAEYYSDSSVGVNPFSDTNGVLSITATAAAPGSNALNLPYDSGVITTYKSYSQLYGYFEVRAELPSGAGLWPAFWLLPTDGQQKTELDVFEVLGQNATTLHATTHSDVAGEGQSQAIAVPNTSTGFHTYGVDWEPTTITFYMDGQAIATTPTPADMDVPMYMLLNLAVGGAGSWPGAANSSTPLPASLQIDYVRAYATAATLGRTDPNPPTATAVLPAIQAAVATGTAWLGVTVLHYGNQDPGTRQAGVGVALVNAAGLVVATGVTASDGTFIFHNLAAGTYQIEYLPPGSLMLQPGSQANVTTGLTAPVTLVAGQGISLTHETVLSTAHVGGSVLLDGTAVGGIAVALLDPNQAVVATTTTDANGKFGFYAPAGTYAVRYTPPGNDSPVAGSHADPTTGISPTFALTAGNAFLLSPEMLTGTTRPSITAPINAATTYYSGEAMTFAASPHAMSATDPLTDNDYYLAQNADVARAGMDPSQHYETYGWHEGRDPNALFDTNYYLQQNPDVKASGVDPLTHYETYGWKEGRNPSASFDTNDYLKAYSDVKSAGIDPLTHFFEYGAAEGRSIFHT